MFRRYRLSACAPLLSLIFLLAGGATASAEPINLMWDPNQGTVSGYMVHVGTQSGNYTQRYDVGNTTSFTFPDAVAGQRYCFAVSAYADTLEGARSAEVCGYSDAPPTLANPGNQSSVVGNPVSLQLNGSDPYGQPVSYSATGLPPGVNLQNSTGFISGTGTTAGTYTVSARVFDGRLYATQGFTWTMASAPVSPVSVSIAGPTSSATYATTSSTVTLQGSAAGGSGIAEVRWANDRGGAGVASGTTSWSAASVALQSGSNVLTVTARDSEGREAMDTLTVTYSVLQSQVTLTARPYVHKGRKYVALTWAGCGWRLVDVIRDSLPLTSTENDGAYTDMMKKGGSFTYRLCETGNRTNCSNSVAVIF